jgi:hypothetical protein
MGGTPSDSLAIQYACSHGIPLSIFLGRVANPGEPYWLNSDTVTALEWQIAENLRCSGCGLPRDRTMRGEDEVEFKAEALLCHACRAMESKAGEIAGQDKVPPLAGMRFLVTEVDKAAG